MPEQIEATNEPDLEGALDRFGETALRIKAQRDDLLALVVACRKQIDAIIEDGVPTDWRMWRDDLDAAIAKPPQTSSSTAAAPVRTLLVNGDHRGPPLGDRTR